MLGGHALVKQDGFAHGYVSPSTAHDAFEAQVDEARVDLRN